MRVAIPQQTAGRRRPAFRHGGDDRHTVAELEDFENVGRRALTLAHAERAIDTIGALHGVRAFRVVPGDQAAGVLLELVGEPWAGNEIAEHVCPESERRQASQAPA